MIRRALKLLGTTSDVMLSLHPVWYSWQIGAHRLPFVSFFLCGMLLYLHAVMKKVEYRHAWLADPATFLSLLIPTICAGVMLYFFSILNARKIALTFEPSLLPALRAMLPAALLLNILCAAIIVMAWLVAFGLGLREAAYVVLLLWLLSAENLSPVLRKSMFWLSVCLAILFVTLAASSNILYFRSGEGRLLRLGMIVALVSVIITGLNLVAASIIRPRWGIPIALTWWLTLWVPNVYVMATRVYILSLMYEYFTQTGVHVFTALATSAWVIWLLQNSRAARFQSGGNAKPKWHLIDLRETLVGLSALAYRLQLRSYIRRGLGGMSSLSVLSLGPAIHMGTMWVWALGIMGLMMAIYAYVSPRFFEGAGIWVGMQFMIWAGMTTTLLVIRTFSRRQAELKLASLLPGSLSHADTRRTLARTAFFHILIALLPVALFGGVLIKLPVMPEYPTLNLRPSMFNDADYWLVTVLLMLGACASFWRLLAKFDWLNIPEQRGWFMVGWFLLGYSAICIKLTKLGMVPEWKLLVIACSASALIWLFHQALYGHGAGSMQADRSKEGTRIAVPGSA